VLVGVTGLERLGPKAGRAIVLLCAAHFLFWYGLHLAGDEHLWKYEPWDSIELSVRRPRRHRSGWRRSPASNWSSSVTVEAPAGVGAQCSSHRQRARGMGKRLRCRGKCETASILSRSQSMAIGTRCDTAENFNVSLKWTRWSARVRTGRSSPPVRVFFLTQSISHCETSARLTRLSSGTTMD
jgi:hypothetical protein